MLHGEIKLLKPSLSWHLSLLPLHGRPKSAALSEIYGRLNLHLVRAMQRYCHPHQMYNRLCLCVYSCNMYSIIIIIAHKIIILNTRDIFANFCRRAHLSVQVEVGYGLARDHINSRPADILVQGWDRGKPAAFDVTVTSPLTPVSLNNASASVGAAAYAAECRKHAGVGMIMYPGFSCGNVWQLGEGGSECFFPARFSAFHQPGHPQTQKANTRMGIIINMLPPMVCTIHILPNTNSSQRAG